MVSSPVRISLLALALGSLGAGCTHWGTATAMGPRREVSRRAVGQPHVEEISSSGWGGGFGASGGGSSHGGSAAGAASGSVSGGRAVSRRRHCVQSTEITYARTVEERPEVYGRAGDFLGGGVLAALGVIALGGSASGGDSGLALIGGTFTLGGVGLMAHGALAPSEASKPQVQRTEPTWTETELAEAAGCGSIVEVAPEPEESPAPAVAPAAPAPPPAVAAAPAAAAAPGSPVARLHQLDALRKAGVITEAEYQRKRKAIVDAL